MTKNKYPFEEGDDYWTIEENDTNTGLEVVWSCWDEVSEEIHDDNPDMVYYKTEKEAYEEK